MRLSPRVDIKIEHAENDDGVMSTSVDPRLGCRYHRSTSLSRPVEADTLSAEVVTHATIPTPVVVFWDIHVVELVLSLRHRSAQATDTQRICI